MARQIRLFIRFVFSGTLEANIIGNTKTKLSVANLTSVPRFLRFKEVELFYAYTIGQKSIEEKCRSIENSLQPLKKALKDANSILFDGIIDRDNHTHLSDHSKLLEYLSEQLLKICNSSRGYNFSIYLQPEEAGTGTNVINSIIQMPQIYQCSTLHFDLWPVPQPMLLPVDAISSWLNRTIGDGMNSIGRTPKEYFLKIYAARIQNVVEMCDHLVEVCLFFYKALKMFT